MKPINLQITYYRDPASRKNFVSGFFCFQVGEDFHGISVGRYDVARLRRALFKKSVPVFTTNSRDPQIKSVEFRNDNSKK